MKNLTSILFAILLAGCGNAALENQVAALNDKVQTLESAQAVNFSRLDRTEQRMDTLESGLLFVGGMVVKHDSIVADRQWKRDRAAKRGEFWGSLVKVLAK